MKKSNIILGVFGTTVACAFIFVIFNKKSDAPSANEPSSSQASKSQTPDQPKNAGNGKYVNYNEGELASIRDDRVLFFHAPWCQQCISIEKGITDGSIPNGVTIVKVDYDTNQDLRKKYGVTLQTTFVKIDAQGELIDKYVAYDEPTFDAVKRDFL